ncbi:hypothetical protein BDZ89DRAFT_224781 [Hymenopellis radicata]|nr:hypothetical protein BDZ89DRAFT_224781 [Hymenopellis radicata]
MPRAEQVNHYARACLSTSTSWRRAVIYLIVLHRVSRGPATSANMTFCLVRAPKPDSEMEDVGQLLRGLRVETKHRETLLRPREFKGTVHNEALLMALKTNTEEVDVGDEVKALFMYGDHDRSIGMARKPCFCCHVVAEELNFKLPGTCGRILPWSPPRGIGLNILQRLAYVLERKLEAVLR